MVYGVDLNGKFLMDEISFGELGIIFFRCRGLAVGVYDFRLFFFRRVRGRGGAG